MKTSYLLTLGFLALRNSLMGIYGVQVLLQCQRATNEALGAPTSFIPKQTFAVVSDDQSTCPALSHDSFRRFLRWKLVTPVRVPVYGWKNCTRKPHKRRFGVAGAHVDARRDVSVHLVVFDSVCSVHPYHIHSARIGAGIRCRIYEMEDEVAGVHAGRAFAMYRDARAGVRVL